MSSVETIMAEMANPEQQGLKQKETWIARWPGDAEMANPEQQGLKLHITFLSCVGLLAEMANPEQQGLKPMTPSLNSGCPDVPKWLIQNNKD